MNCVIEFPITPSMNEFGWLVPTSWEMMGKEQEKAYNKHNLVLRLEYVEEQNGGRAVLVLDAKNRLDALTGVYMTRKALEALGVAVETILHAMPKMKD